MVEIPIDIKTDIRLDKYIRLQYPKITQGIIQQALNKRSIRVNGILVKEGGIRVKCPDVIIIPKYFEEYLADGESEKRPSNFNVSEISLAHKVLNNYLIYSNQDLIAISKPTKLSTQGGTKIDLSLNSAINYINSEGKDSSNYRSFRNNLRLVHRLDRDTSGVMLLAKTYESAVTLTRAFKNKEISKIYIAVTYNTPQKSQDLVDYENEVTKYKVLKYSKEHSLSLIQFEPITGKKHQIRRLAARLNIPIVGDKKYNLASNFPNLLLHSYKISLPKKIFDKNIDIVANPPRYFMQYIEKHFHINNINSIYT